MGGRARSREDRFVFAFLYMLCMHVWGVDLRFTVILTYQDAFIFFSRLSHSSFFLTKMFNVLMRVHVCLCYFCKRVDVLAA